MLEVLCPPVQPMLALARAAASAAELCVAPLEVALLLVALLPEVLLRAWVPGSVVAVLVRPVVVDAELAAPALFPPVHGRPVCDRLGDLLVLLAFAVLCPAEVVAGFAPKEELVRAISELTGAR